jgi:hypothetical protein
MDTLHDLMMKDHIEEKMAMGRKHLDHYRRKGLGMSTEQESESDDMKILSAGDVHLHPPQVASPPPAQAPSLLKTALMAASVGLGVPLIGVAGYAIGELLKPDKKVTQPAAEHTLIERDYTIGNVEVRENP